MSHTLTIDVEVVDAQCRSVDFGSGQLIVHREGLPKQDTGELRRCVRLWRMNPIHLLHLLLVDSSFETGKRRLNHSAVVQSRRHLPAITGARGQLKIGDADIDTGITFRHARGEHRTFQMVRFVDGNAVCLLHDASFIVSLKRPTEAWIQMRNTNGRRHGINRLMHDSHLCHGAKMNQQKHE